jgi:hypothetical protein
MPAHRRGKRVVPPAGRKRGDVNEASVCSVLENSLRVGGWRWTHFRPAQTKGGEYRTALSGNKGWPDYFATRGHEAVAIEAKGRYEKPDDEQVEWLRQLDAAGIPTFVANPVTVDEVSDWLLARRPDPTQEEPRAQLR